MTKIDQILPGQVEGQQQKSKTTKTDGPSFQSYLEKAQNAAEGADNQVNQVSDPAAMSEVQQVGAINAIAGQAQEAAVRQAEDLLDSMDEYARLLGGGNTLKQMQGLVDQIRQQADELRQAARGLPDGDELAGLLEDVQTQASVELMKFERGDYNPA